MDKPSNNIILKALRERRSIRKYEEKEINNSLVKELLTAGMYAPSAVNKQPWHFIVIQEPSLLKEVGTFHPNAKMLERSALGILVCADEKQAHHGGYWIQDCSAATQNILLAAHALGLGAVWLGIHPREQRKEGVRRLFKLPDHIQPLSLVSIGYPAEKKEQPDRYRPERIHLNEFGNKWNP